MARTGSSIPYCLTNGALFIGDAGLFCVDSIFTNRLDRKTS